jgi:pimeloyl-ACP methyl ester carboxylesterase
LSQTNLQTWIKSSHVISKDGTKIAYDREGNGPAIILVGGAFQHRAIDQRTKELSNLLSQHFTVYHYDRRGRGDSGDTKPYSVDKEVEDIEALIKEAGGSASLFGMSSGGALALTAAKHGLRINKLALYEIPFHSGDSNSLQASQNYTKQLHALLAEGRRGDAAAFALTTWGLPKEAIAGMRQSPVWSLFESVAPTLSYDDAVMGDGSVPVDIIKSVRQQTLVLDGGASPAFMQNAATIAKDLSHAQHRTLAGQTHDVDPKVLAPVLIEFFSK